MNQEEIIKLLKQMYLVLDDVQEGEICQNNKELMHEIGEILGSIDNAIDVLEKRRKRNENKF